MKRLIILIIVIMFFTFPIKTYATSDIYTQEINEITKEYSNELDLSFDGIINFINRELDEKIKEPLELLFKTMVVILISSVLKFFQTKDFEDIGQTIDKITVISVFLILMPSLAKVIKIITENLFDINSFMTTFIPIFAGISAASGEFLTSTLYTGIFLTGLLFVSNLCVNIIIPSFNVFLAVNLTSSAVDEIRLDSFLEFYLKLIKWVLKAIVSFICFSLTLQTTITQSQDNLALKIGEGVTGVIPVIGGALQDAVGSVYSSMEVVKGFAGLAGISAVAVIFLPSLVLVLIYWIVFNILIIIADVLNTNVVVKLLSGYKNLIELIISLIILFLVLLIFSTTIMISLTGGV